MNLAEANHILRLTDTQLAIVRALLRPAVRDRYLKIIAGTSRTGRRRRRAFNNRRQMNIGGPHGQAMAIR